MNLEEAELLLGDSGEELEFAIRCTLPPQSQGGGHALAFPSRVYVLRATTVAERTAFVDVLRQIILKVQEGVDRGRLSSGATTTLRYTQGFHDDGVCAFALAWRAFANESAREPFYISIV